MAALQLALSCTGWIADRAVHGPIRRGAPVEVAAVASRDPDRARRYADSHGIAGSGTLNEVLSRPDVDAIYVAGPNACHASDIQRALAAGKHVLCEKPLCWQATVASELTEQAAAAGVLLWEAAHYRWHPAVAGVLAELAGRPLRAEVRFGWHAARPADIRWDRALGGGALLDVGWYGLDLVQALAPDCVVSAATVAERRAGVDACIELDLTGDGNSARVSASLVAAQLQCQAAMTVAGAHWDWQLPFLIGSETSRLTRDGCPVPLPHQDVPTYDFQLRAFADAVAGGPVDPVISAAVSGAGVVARAALMEQAVAMAT